jgi:hypothetical protein
MLRADAIRPYGASCKFRALKKCYHSNKDITFDDGTVLTLGRVDCIDPQCFDCLVSQRTEPH